MVERIDIVVTERGARTVRRSLGDIGGAAEGASSQVDELRRLLRDLAVGAIFTAAINSTIGFQTEIAEISTLVNTATFDLQGLTNAALDQAVAFGSQPALQTQAFYDIISAGAGTAAEATETLTAANRLAVGGVTEVGVAANGLTAILNAYGEAVQGAADVSDILFVGVRAGRTTIEELSATLGRVAPLAASAGVGFDELTAAVAALTTGGISTNEAVTGTRAILAAIVRPTAEATEAARNLGLEFSATALQSQGLQQFLQNVITQTGGSTDALSQLFTGVEALVPILALAGEAGTRFEDILVQLEDRAGATEEAFNRLANTPGFQIDRILSGLTAEAIRTASTFTEALVPALRFVADNLGILATGVRTLVVLLGTALALRAIPAAVAAIGTLTVALAANPVILFVSAVTALTVGLSALASEITLTEGGLATLRDVGVIAFQEILREVRALLSFVGDIGNAISDFATSIFGELNLSAQDILLIYARTVDTIVGLFVGAGNAIVIAFGAVPENLEVLFQEFFNFLSREFTENVNVILGAINRILEFTGRATIQLLEPFEVEITGRSQNIGRLIDEAITSGIREQNNAQETILGIIQRAEDAAREREIEQQQREAQVRAATDALQPAGPAGLSESQQAFQDLLRTLEAEQRLLGFNNQEREIQEALLSAETTLKRELTSIERGLLEPLLRTNQALSDQRAILDDINAPSETYQRSLDALVALQERGAISAEQFAARQRDLRIETLALATDFDSGLERSLLSLQRELENTAAAVERTVVRGFQAAGDAIADFAVGAGTSFFEFVDAITRELARLAAQQLLIQPILGTLTGFLGFGGTAAAGASVGFPLGAGGGFGGAPLLTPFQQGGIVGSPTIFDPRQGFGVAGEAGLEGILPLQRDSRGRLGVSAVGGDAGTTQNNIVNINVEVTGRNGESNDDLARRTAEQISREFDGLLTSRLRDQMRFGGVLNRGQIT